MTFTLELLYLSSSLVILFGSGFGLDVFQMPPRRQAVTVSRQKQTKMLLIYKNKGILVAPYFIGSLIGTAVLSGVLKRNVGGVFSRLDFYDILGISLIICALLTYLTKNDYYLDRYGEKQKMDIPNEFFFLKMDVWVYIFLVAAAIFFGNSVFGYFGKPDF